MLAVEKRLDPISHERYTSQAELPDPRAIEQANMTDLISKKLIVLKGILFLIIINHPTLKVVLALCVLIWASARFYYFLFYVLEKYVDPTLRYAGLPALLRHQIRKRGPSSQP